MINPVKPFLDFIDNRAVVRRMVLFFTLWMTYEITVSAWSFAGTSTFDGIGTAAVIAAVTAPFAALQGFVFHSYSQGRKE